MKSNQILKFMSNLTKITVIILLFGIGSCGLFDSADEAPMFIELSSVSVNADEIEGSSGHAIKEIWVAADGQNIGVFEPGTKVPVLDTDETTNMVFFAGIHRNEIRSDHTMYPFYDQISLFYDYSPGGIIEVDLEFNYKENLTFQFIEDFETTNQIFTQEVDGDDSTKLVITNDDTFEGFGSGYAKLDTMNPEIEFATTVNFTDVPTNGTPVYLEMDYKTEVPLNVGLRATVGVNEANSYWLALLPNEEWEKVYIDLSELLIQSQLEEYRILMGANVGDMEEAEFFIDNVKFIHF